MERGNVVTPVDPEALPIVSDAEIEAALQEAAQQSDNIPDLDDGSSSQSASEKVTREPPPPEAPAPDQPKSEPATAPTEPTTIDEPEKTEQPTTDAPPEQSVAEKGPSILDKLRALFARFASWWKLASDGTSAAAPKLRQLAELMYVGIDKTLWALNRPFERLTPDQRQLIGSIAAVTIVISIAAVYALPLLAPPKDPISVLSRQSEAASEMLEAESLGGEAADADSSAPEAD